MSAVMDFKKRKLQMLDKLNSGFDKSIKGSIDEPIIKLIEHFNRSNNFFTLSSCSGRITLISHPSSKLKYNNSFLLNSHKIVNINKTYDLILNSLSSGLNNLLYLRFEPFILALEADSLINATFLISLARNSGYNDSAIKKIVVTIKSSNRLEIPLGNGDLIDPFSSNWLKYVLGVANDNLNKNLSKLAQFSEAVFDKIK